MYLCRCKYQGTYLYIAIISFIPRHGIHSGLLASYYRMNPMYLIYAVLRYLLHVSYSILFPMNQRFRLLHSQNAYLTHQGAEYRLRI